MKDRLIAVFNALTQIETKGQSTLIMSDCLREIQAIIQELDNKKEETK